MAVILGIDLGSRITGYDILRQDRRILSYLGSGCIRTKVGDLPGRLKLIYVGVSKTITQFQPDCLAIEQVFVAKNADSALKLSQARGVSILAAMNLDLPMFEICCPSGKTDGSGHGVGGECQVQHMVRTLLTTIGNPLVDAADALAMAITYCHVSQHALSMGNGQAKLTAG